MSVVVSQARSPGGMLYRKCRSDLGVHYYDRHWCFDDKPPEFITEDEFELARTLYGEDRHEQRHWMNDPDWKEVMTEAEEYEQDKSDEAIRYDLDKPMWNLLDWEFIHEVVLVLTKGASKYSPENWKKGMNFSRPFNSLIRHVYSWWRGENNDPETGCSHLAHACANLMFLFRYTIDKEKYERYDDRTK